MADIHISRPHALGLQAARKIAAQWVQQAQSNFGLTCTYTEGALYDEVSFSRSGVQGRLTVSEDFFELTAQLGFLLSAFKERMASEIGKNLDELLRP